MRKRLMPVPVDIPLPRSLTRYARSFGCGERYGLTDKDVAGKYVNAGGGRKDAPLPVFHRLRPPDKHHRI